MAIETNGLIELQDVVVDSSQNSNQSSEEKANKFLQVCKDLGRLESIAVVDLLDMIKHLDANELKTTNGNGMNVFHLLIYDGEKRWKVKEFDSDSAAKVVQIISEIGNKFPTGVIESMMKQDIIL